MTMLNRAGIVLSALIALATCQQPALAATGDPLPKQGAVLIDEPFDRADLCTRWQAGIGPYSGSWKTRSLWGNGERQLYVGCGFGGYGIEPWRIDHGIAQLAAKPIPPALLARVRADGYAAADKAAAEWQVKSATTAAAVGTAPGAPLLTRARIDRVGWTSGIIGSRQTVPAIGTYVSCRMKLYAQAGFIPACWAYDYTTGARVEFDIMEAMPSWTGPDCYAVTLHSPWGTPKVSRRVCLPKGALYGRWHEFGGLLTASEAVAYLDGREVARMPILVGFQKAQLTIHANLAAGWPQFPSPGARDIGRLQIDRVTARIVAP